MKISIQFPRGEMLKTCVVTESPPGVVAEPRFLKGNMRPVICYVEVVGDSGQTKSAVLRVDGATGAIRLINCTDEPAPFDKPASEAKPPEVKSQPPAPADAKTTKGK